MTKEEKNISVWKRMTFWMSKELSIPYVSIASIGLLTGGFMYGLKRRSKYGDKEEALAVVEKKGASDFKPLKWWERVVGLRYTKDATIGRLASKALLSATVLSCSVTFGSILFLGWATGIHSIKEFSLVMSKKAEVLRIKKKVSISKEDQQELDELERLFTEENETK